jgi:hypothetical protein
MTQEIDTCISSIDISAGGELRILKDDKAPFGYAIFHITEKEEHDRNIFVSRYGFKQLIQAMIEAL